MNPHTEVSKTQVKKFKYPKDLPKRYKQYLSSANNKGIVFEFIIVAIITINYFFNLFILTQMY